MPVERHPLEPFLPPQARLLMLGSFPPPRKRWCMEFFYPNRSNQMWNVFGLVFYGDDMRFVDRNTNSFKQPDIEVLLREHGIAVFDTAMAVRRLSGNASDKDLEIVEQTDIAALLERIPLCHDMVCTGQKSFSVLSSDFGVPVPAIGTHNEFVIAGRAMRLWRMPSTSRAYPMPLAEKAAHYSRMMKAVGIL
ncbi:MAG: uracil-DNA glycosylase family protein [Bacteroidales bacterium]|nr:uracil-DNA glycosylase family protein [Bacteroidales bacterium]